MSITEKQNDQKVFISHNCPRHVKKCFSSPTSHNIITQGQVFSNQVQVTSQQVTAPSPHHHHTFTTTPGTLMKIRGTLMKISGTLIEIEGTLI